LVAFLNRPEIFELDGYSSAEGYSRDATQLGHQLKDAVLAWLYSFFVTLLLLCISTGLKWLLSVTGIAHDPWRNEQALEVSTEHVWAAGEAQIAGKDYELKVLSFDGSPATSRNTTIVETQYRIGDAPPAANGGPVRGNRLDESERR
jgi:hypothetical protein